VILIKIEKTSIFNKIQAGYDISLNGMQQKAQVTLSQPAQTTHFQLKSKLGKT
jgi:hypothetical protein